MEKFALYVMMESYCLYSYHVTGENNYRKELLKIYDDMLRAGDYKTNEKEYFNISLFRNMVIISFELDEFKWLNNLISGYSDQLHPDSKEDTKNVSMALLHLGNTRYEEALDYITKVKSDSLQKVKLKMASEKKPKTRNP